MLKKVYVLLLIFFANLLCSEALWANSSQLKRWGDNAVRTSQSIAPAWIAGAFTVCGILSMFGLRIANQLLGKILLGSALIFGGTIIATTAQSIFR